MKKLQPKSRRPEYLDHKLVFLKTQLNRDAIRARSLATKETAGPRPKAISLSPNANSSADGAASSRALLRPPSLPTILNDTDSVDKLGSVWQEPLELSRPARSRTPIAAETTENLAQVGLNAPRIDQNAESNVTTPAVRPLTSVRHTPTPATRPNKPQAPPHDPRIIGYLADGGSRVFKLSRREARIERNRLIFIIILCLGFLAIVLGIISR